MISQKESDELKSHIFKVRAADDLMDRFAQGFTNKDADEVKKSFADAATGLDNFIQSITEKPMDHFNDFESTFKLKASVQTYELSLADLASLFSEKLGVPASRITVTEKKQFEHGDAIGEGHYVFGGVVITVKA